MYYNCRVKVKIENDQGKIKTQTRAYIVEAVSVTDAEVKITKEFSNMVDDWELASVSETKILEIIK